MGGCATIGKKKVKLPALLEGKEVDSDINKWNTRQIQILKHSFTEALSPKRGNKQTNALDRKGFLKIFPILKKLPKVISKSIF